MNVSSKRSVCLSLLLVHSLFLGSIIPLRGQDKAEDCKFCGTWFDKGHNRFEISKNGKLITVRIVRPNGVKVFSGEEYLGQISHIPCISGCEGDEDKLSLHLLDQGSQRYIWGDNDISTGIQYQGWHFDLSRVDVVEPKEEEEKDPLQATRHYKASEETSLPETHIEEVAVVDQTPIAQTSVMTGLADLGARSLLRNERTLFVYGRKLPKDRTEPIELKSTNSNISYKLLALSSEKRTKVQLWDAARKKVQSFKTPEQKVAFEKMDSMLVSAELKGPMKPDFYDIEINGVKKSWYLAYGNVKANLSFVRDTGNLNADGLSKQTEQVDLIYLPEAVKVEIATEGDIKEDNIDICVLRNGSPVLKLGQPLFLTARRVPTRSQSGPTKYMTEAFNIFPENGLHPPSPANGLEFPAKHGDRLSIELRDPRLLIFDPTIARAFVPNAIVASNGPYILPAQSERWSRALERADTAFPVGKYGERVKLDNPPKFATGISDALREQLLSGKLKLPHEIATDVVRQKIETEEHLVASISTTAAELKLGHVAAMYLLKDTFIDMMEDYRLTLPRIEGEWELRGFRDLIARMHYAKDPRVAGLMRTKVAGPKDANKFLQDRGPQVSLEDALFAVNDPFYGASEYTFEDYDNIFDAALGRDRGAYTLSTVKTALDKYKAALDFALSRAKDITDDRSLDALMKLTGVGFKQVVNRLNSRLMGFDQRKGMWVPDLTARKYAIEIESVADEFAAQKNISDAELQVVLLALGLVQILGSANLLLRITVNAVFAADLVLNITPEYVRQHLELSTALGASGVLGTERLNIAEAEKTPEWAFVLAFGGTALGLVADLGEVLSRSGAIARGSKLLANLGDRSLKAFRQQPKLTQADELAAMVQAVIERKNTNILTEANNIAADELTSLVKESETAASSIENASKLGTESSEVVAKSAVKVEEINAASETVHNARSSAPKGQLKDLEIRESILNELKNNSTPQITREDFEFVQNPDRGLTADQKKQVLKTLLEDHQGWQSVKDDFIATSPKISKLEMYKIVQFRTKEVDSLVNESLAAVAKQVGVPAEFKPPSGSSSLTSDYDISVKGDGAEKVVAEFNRRFRSDPRFKNLESATVFDTNVYTDPVYELFHAKTADGFSLTLEPLQADELKQLMFDQMETRKYFNDIEWKLNKEQLIGAAPSLERRQIIEYVLGQSEEVEKIAQGQISGKLGKPAELVRRSDPDAYSRASTDVYLDVLSDIDKLKTESRRLAKLGASSKLEDFISEPRVTEILGNRDYNTMLKKLEALIKEGGPEAESIVVDLKNQVHELLSKQIRSKQGLALYFASEAYQTEGAIAHVVGELQEGGWAGKITKESLLAGFVDRKRGVTTAQYLNSFFENRANMFKEVKHARDIKPPRVFDPRLAAAKAAKYFVRQLDAASQAKIALKGLISEDIIELTIKIVSDKDKLETVAELLRAKQISGEQFIQQVERVSNHLSVKAVNELTINKRAAEITRYLKETNPELAMWKEGPAGLPKQSSSEPRSIALGQGSSGGTGLGGDGRKIPALQNRPNEAPVKSIDPNSTATKPPVDPNATIDAAPKDPNGPVKNPLNPPQIDPNATAAAPVKPAQVDLNGTDGSVTPVQTDPNATVDGPIKSSAPNDARRILDQLEKGGLSSDAVENLVNDLVGKAFVDLDGRTFEIQEVIGKGVFSQVVRARSDVDGIIVLKFRLKGDGLLGLNQREALEAARQASDDLAEIGVRQLRITRAYSREAISYLEAETRNVQIIKSGTTPDEFVFNIPGVKWTKAHGDAFIDMTAKMIKGGPDGVAVIAEDLNQKNIFFEQLDNGLVCGVLDHDRIGKWSSDYGKRLVGVMEKPVIIENGERIEIPYAGRDSLNINSLKDVAPLTYKFENAEDFMIRMLEHKGWITYDGNKWTSRVLDIEYLKSKLNLDKYLPRKRIGRLLRIPDSIRGDRYLLKAHWPNAHIHSRALLDRTNASKLFARAA